MALDVSHDCYSGGYIGFNFWRNAVAVAAGYGTRVVPNSYGMEVANIDFDLFTRETIMGIWKDEPEDPLYVLLVHADNEGKIAARHVGKLADALEKLDMPDRWKDITNEFIAGLRRAEAKKESVIFS